MLSLSGNLSSERRKVQHLTEYGLQRLRFLNGKKLDIINEQHVDRLFNTTCVRLDEAGHAAKRNLSLNPSWRIQLEVRDSVQNAKGSETVFFLCITAASWEKVGNISSNKLVAACSSG